MEETERLKRIAHLVYEWGDMMLDGPDDSDVAMANGWLAEAFTLAREYRRELRERLKEKP